MDTASIDKMDSKSPFGFCPFRTSRQKVFLVLAVLLCFSGFGWQCFDQVAVPLNFFPASLMTIPNKLEGLPLRVVYMKQPKSVWFLLSDQFCLAVCPIFVSIWPTDITLHKIRQRYRKFPISKLVREPGKILWTAWRNQSDVTKIRSATVHVNGALEILSSRVLEFEGKARSKPIGGPFRCFLIG